MGDVKLAAKSLVKVFGDDPDRALALVDQGRSQREILDETGMTVAVRDASFSVGAGEIFVVMGLSGSGKSTLVRMLNRLFEPTRGEVVIDGLDVTKATDAELREIRLTKLAMVFQHFALFPHMTVAENAAYGLKIKGLGRDERRAKALDALERVGLAAWADRSPSDLSGGMQQRVGLARGLAVDPEILLMDEPFSALDPLIRSDMQQELIQLQHELEKTIVFITHDLNEALLLGDQIAIMRDGSFVQTGTPEEIVAQPADDYVAAFTRDVDRGRVFTAGSVMEAAETVELETATAEDARGMLAESGRDGLYVLDRGRVAGLVTRIDLAAAETGAPLARLVSADFPRAEPEARLNEVFEACSRGVPVAVVDAAGRLSGIVDPRRVFTALAGETDAPEEAAE